MSLISTKGNKVETAQQKNPVLVVDVGGTRTRLALAYDAGARVILTESHTVFSQDFATFEEVLAHYRGQVTRPWGQVMVGVAGPVAQQTVQLTNLPWRIEAAYVESSGYGPCCLINDLEAVAWGVTVLTEEEKVCLQVGRPKAGNRAVIAAGTGLGEAGMVAMAGGGWQPFATEGGHASFAPRDERELALWHELAGRYGHVSWERVVSGMALPELHRFLCRYRGVTRSDSLAQELLTREPAAALTEAALSGRDELCEELLLWFVSLYGAEAGNLALKVLCRGGLYLAGGVAPKILPFLQQPDFLRAFVDKGRMRVLLESIPVYVILTDQVALYGLALAARQASSC